MNAACPPCAPSPGLQGIGAGFVPGVLNTQVFDEVLKVGVLPCCNVCLVPGPGRHWVAGAPSSRRQGVRSSALPRWPRSAPPRRAQPACLPAEPVADRCTVPASNRASAVPAAPCRSPATTLWTWRCGWPARRACLWASAAAQRCRRVHAEFARAGPGATRAGAGPVRPARGGAVPRRCGGSGVGKCGSHAAPSRALCLHRPRRQLWMWPSGRRTRASWLL